MRSVVVVLPASMCAMMPMLRTFLRSVVMSTATVGHPLDSRDSWSLVTRDPRRCGGGSGRRSGITGCVVPTVSPAVVGEGLVGLGHLVGVLTALDCGAEAVGGVEDLVHEALGHGLLPARGRVVDQPAQGQGHGARPAHLDRHLVGGATDAAAADLEGGLDVVERALEGHD